MADRSNLRWLLVSVVAMASGCGDDTGSGGGAEGGASAGGSGGSGEGGAAPVCEYGVITIDDNCNSPCTRYSGQTSEICTKTCDPTAADPDCFEGTECVEGGFNAYCLVPCADGCEQGTECDTVEYIDHCVPT